MSAFALWFIGIAAFSAPVSNGLDSGSCIGSDKQPFDIRRVMLLQNRELVLDSGAGPIRLVVQQQHFRAYLENSRDGEHWVTNIGERVSEDKRADVFLTLGFLDGRPVLYWRETFQHRSFRQGVMRISPEVVAKAHADWREILTPICEGRGGVDVWE
jgi:hypothetical protein